MIQIGWLVSREGWRDCYISYVPVRVFKTKEMADAFVKTMFNPYNYAIEEIEMEGF